MTPPNLARAFDQPAKRAFAPDPELLVWQWAERYRELPAETPEPGRKSYDRTPYLREIAAALSPEEPWEHVILVKGSQVGAPLALDTAIPTPSGWTTMGKVRVGDLVFDEQGKPSRVMSCSRVFYNRECYKITFSDGATIVADAQHRWTVWDEKKYAYRRVRVVTTEEIAGTVKVKAGGKERNRYAIELTHPLELPEAVLPLDPYALGVWLGDGSLHSNHVSVHEDDAEEMATCLRAVGHRVVVRTLPEEKGRCCDLHVDPAQAKDESRCHRGHLKVEVPIAARGSCPECRRQRDCLLKRTMREHVFRVQGPCVLRSALRAMNPIVNARTSPFRDGLNALGLLKGKKHIPRPYLRASYLQRLALLQGLMDTDGTIGRNGRAEFCNVSAGLIRGVRELLRTLGLKATVATRKAKDGVQFKRQAPTRSAPSFRLSFLAYRDQPVCRLRRKFKRQRASTGPNRRPTETKRRRIVSVEQCRSVPVRCIGVDSPNHLYLAGWDMVPTHNTDMAADWLGHTIHLSPCSLLAVWPTVEFGKRKSRELIDPLVDSTPELRGLIGKPRTKDANTTILVKQFPGGRLIITGANSGVGLRSTSARRVFLDEIDAFPEVTAAEGDPIRLALRATHNYKGRRKILMASTPLHEATSLILREANRASRVADFHLPCPRCGFFQALRWEQMRFDVEGDGEHAEVANVRYVCVECKGAIRNHEKTAMLAAGKWVDRWRRGAQSVAFFLSALYSPVGWLGWDDAARWFVRAKGKPAEEQTFENMVLGKGWAESREHPDWQVLYDRREEYREGVVQPGIGLLTLAVDVQQNRLEVELKGWGRETRSWSLFYRVIPGDVMDDEVWAELDKLLATDYPVIGGDGTMPVWCLAIDSGSYPQRVYKWARGHPQPIFANGAIRVREPRTVMVVKGRDIWGQILLTPQKASHEERQRGLKVVGVGVSGLKRELYRSLRQPRTPDGREPFGFCHWPATESYGERFFKQLTSEHLVQKGIKEAWELPAGVRNESLDTHNYSRAAAAACGLDRMTTEEDWLELEAQLPPSIRVGRRATDGAATSPERPAPSPPPRDRKEDDGGEPSVAKSPPQAPAQALQASTQPDPSPHEAPRSWRPPVVSTWGTRTRLTGGGGW